MTEPAQDTVETTEEFAIVEVFGHRRHAGRIAEVERFGSKFLRIDIPIDGAFDKGRITSHFYSGGSIFSMTPCDQKTAEKANVGIAPARLEYRDEDDDDFREVGE